MLEKCCGSMNHYEHLCSLTLNSCAVENARSAKAHECSPCDDKSHRHFEVCTPSIIGT